jgi:hypothetical protein
MNDKGYRVTESAPATVKQQRSLYIDLIGDRSEVTDRLGALGEQVSHVRANPRTVVAAPAPYPFRLSENQTLLDRVAELAGASVPYAMSQLAPGVTPGEQIDIVDGVCRYFAQITADTRAGCIDIAGRTRVVFDGEAKVSDSGYSGLAGRDLLPACACFIDQDFGIVLRRPSGLFYVYESSEFEKTPKRVEGGENNFLGNDFLEWHRRIPHYGLPLASIFERVDALFADELLDMLVVDLRGRHLYGDGEILVRRYERDYVVPLHNRDGQYVGMAVFADLFIQDINTLRNPLSGGKYLVVESPLLFNQRFQVVKHAGFREHPSGVRSADGTPAPAWA